MRGADRRQDRGDRGGRRRTDVRDNASGFVAYGPVRSIERGKTIASTTVGEPRSSLFLRDGDAADARGDRRARNPAP
jgi:hypothetical protein